MSGVRVLVGTRKGAFILTGDGVRVAVERVVRTDHPTLVRRRQNVGDAWR